MATNYDKTQQQQQHHFPQIFIPQNTPYSASFFHNENSAKYTFRKLRIPHSTPSLKWQQNVYTLITDNNQKMST